MRTGALVLSQRANYLCEVLCACCAHKSHVYCPHLFCTWCTVCTRGGGGGGGGKKAASQEQRSGKEKMLSRMINAPWRPPNHWTEEERDQHFKIGRTYARNSIIKNNVWESDMAWKMALRDEAVGALPLDLRKHAMTHDETPFPLERRMATWTPPIPNFDSAFHRRKLQRELDAKAMAERRSAGL